MDDYVKEIGKGLDFQSGSFVDVNGLMLTNKELQTLDNYEIPYTNCKSLKEIVYLVEDALLDYEEDENLLDLSYAISERDYYLNTNK